MQFTCKDCGLEQQSRLAPCPDNKPGCCVAHYDSRSFVCSKCGTDNQPDWKNTVFVERVGIGIVNSAAISALEIKPTRRCIDCGGDSQGCIYCNDCAKDHPYDFSLDDFNFDANREKGGR